MAGRPRLGVEQIGERLAHRDERIRAVALVQFELRGQSWDGIVAA